jgi:hypothetical protein
LLEPANRLTNGGVRDAQAIARGAKALRLRDSNERGHSVELVSHW